MCAGMGGPRLGIKGDIRLLDTRLLEAGVREPPMEKGPIGSIKELLELAASADLAVWALVEPVLA